MIAFTYPHFTPILPMQVLQNKGNRLFLILGCFFIANALIAEFIGVKIFSLESTVGAGPFQWSLFGIDGTLNFTAGVLLWPMVFVMTDIINEYFGVRGVRFLSYLGVFLISYAFLMVYMAISLSPADFWTGSYVEKGVPNAQNAFSSIFGQGLWIIVGSLTAFLIGQIIDALVFRRVRRWTGEQKIWLRATASTMVSQLIDSFVVLYIAFVLGADWTMNLFLAVGIVNYMYKVLMAILMIPLLYVVHYMIDRYLGAHQAEELKIAAGHHPHPDK